MVDITLYWGGFSSASKALANCVYPENVKDIANKHFKMIGSV